MLSLVFVVFWTPGPLLYLTLQEPGRQRSPQEIKKFAQGHTNEILQELGVECSSSY